MLNGDLPDVGSSRCWALSTILTNAQAIFVLAASRRPLESGPNQTCILSLIVFIAGVAARWGRMGTAYDGEEKYAIL